MTAASPSPFSSLKGLRPFWQVTLASFLGWFLDAFDQTTLMFTLPDISHDLGCSISLLGGVLFGQSLGRAVGNTAWGWLADRYGRKPAFMLGIVWFALFSALTGLSHSLWMLMIVQFCFGVGFGGEWTASAALLMESVPATLRPIASAIMMSGYEIGYFAAAATQALLLPHYGWRLLFFIGLIPALLAIFIRIGVPESPLWLANHHKNTQYPKTRRRFSWSGAALQAIALMSFLEFQKAAIYTFYPTILRSNHHLSPQMIFWPITLYCLGSFLGKLLCGTLAERFGDERIMQAAIVIVMLSIWPFLCASSWSFLLISAFIMGAAASGVFALVPHYLAQRFPSDQRSFGMGLSYALGSIGQGLASKLIPVLGPTVATLPISAIALVLGSSAVSAGITTLKPRKLPKF
ncbi:MFS transporter [Saccharibacter sp. 17.LH.SD]|uniref:MFS transporter n=1 Tax=Saccharibacter sp. 17.LH.SD TaxID=2689393 RepID=UPI00136B24BB|nr:MFS transporter [Saccharibacter sp. 17.LH.SD]MXV43881.1 MFS transporter [Saccharibacter sp. 17.LH.SD]